MRRECRERFPRPPRVSDHTMHHGTCVKHVPWCMTGSLTSGFLVTRWRGTMADLEGGAHKIMIFAIYNSIMIFFHEAHRNNLLIRSKIRVITHRCSRTLPWVVSSIGHILGRRVDSPAAIPWSSCSADRQTARSRQGHFDADLVNSLRPDGVKKLSQHWIGQRVVCAKKLPGPLLTFVNCILRNKLQWNWNQVTKRFLVRKCIVFENFVCEMLCRSIMVWPPYINLFFPDTSTMQEIIIYVGGVVLSREMFNSLGRATHICVSKLTNIGADNGLTPVSTPNHYLNQWRDIVIWTLGNKLQWSLNRN